MYLLGIHLDGSAALIRKKGGGIEWVKRFDVKRLDTLYPLLESKPYQLVTGLSANAILLRTLKFQLKTKREILAALPFQVEGLLPISIEDLILKPFIHKDEVLLLAAKKNALEEHLTECATEGLDPDRVSCAPLALWRFARHFFPEAQNLFLVHFGERENILIAIVEGHLKLSHSFFLESPQELERSLAYAQKKCPEATQLLVTGDCPDMPVLMHLERLHLPSHAHEMGQHAIALGLAFDAQARDEKSLQLRRGAYTPSKVLQKRKKRLLSYLGACAAAFLFTLCSTQLILKAEERKILSSFPEIPKTSAQKAIAIAEKKILEERRALSPRMNLPKVSDLLAWLSTDPLFLPKEGELAIEELRYKLLTDPNKEGSMRAHVELQVRFSTPSVGRHLREGLLADRTFIDQKEEVKWTGEHNRAKIAFRFKGRS